MTKVFIYSDSTLDSFYEQTLQYLHEKYHNHPSTLSDQPISEAEASRISYYDGMGRDLARHFSSGPRSGNRTGYRDSNGFSGISGNINLGKAVF